jgi:isopentenyl diphosphate isomerase/L-lactate dehydrogenase-like FMN-dependent dehydrogenase
VLLGRPWLWGLALEGEAGVEEVLRRFLAELDLTMALTGYARPSELGAEALHRHPLG